MAKDAHTQFLSITELLKGIGTLWGGSKELGTWKICTRLVNIHSVLSTLMKNILENVAA